VVISVISLLAIEAKTSWRCAGLFSRPEVLKKERHRHARTGRCAQKCDRLEGGSRLVVMVADPQRLRFNIGF
jgi:hypothetical protein